MLKKKKVRQSESLKPNGDDNLCFFPDKHEDKDQHAGPVLCTDLQVVWWS